MAQKTWQKGPGRNSLIQYIFIEKSGKLLEPDSITLMRGFNLELINKPGIQWERTLLRQWWGRRKQQSLSEPEHRGCYAKLKKDIMKIMCHWKSEEDRLKPRRPDLGKSLPWVTEEVA